MSVEIRKREFEGFFRVPFNVYGEQFAYVSPMKSDLKRMLDDGKNPLFQSPQDYTFMTAIRGGQAVGRIVVHVHVASNAAHGTNLACFGFFDCENDEVTAKALLDAAERWAAERGFSEIVGNFNLTAMQQCGVQTEGFDKQGFTDMIQNPAHIPALLEANGYKPFFPMTTFELDVDRARPTGKALPEGNSFSFVDITKRRFKQHLEDARIVLNDGFADNPMFVPLTAKEFEFQAGEMMTILDPRLSSLVECDGEPVGVIICIPDLNGFLKATRSRISIWTPWHFLRYRLNRRRAVIIFYSVASSKHGQGIMGAMLDRTLDALRSAGYKKLGITWIADVNPASLRQMEKLGADPLHKLHLFKKAL